MTVTGWYLNTSKCTVTHDITGWLYLCVELHIHYFMIYNGVYLTLRPNIILAFKVATVPSHLITYTHIKYILKHTHIIITLNNSNATLFIYIHIMPQWAKYGRDLLVFLIAQILPDENKTI